jgi:hypothetical protein
MSSVQNFETDRLAGVLSLPLTQKRYTQQSVKPDNCVGHYYIPLSNPEVYPQYLKMNKVCLDCFSFPSRRRLNPAPLLSAAEGVDPYENIVFLHIRSTGENVLGFLILGVNPRKQHDDDYRLSTELLSRQLATSMAAAVL